MSYKGKYSERIEVPEDVLSAVQKMVIDGLIREGEFSTRDYFIQTLEQEVASYTVNAKGDINVDWLDGVNYCIQLLKEAKLVNE